LLGFAEEHLDAPASGVGFQQGADVECVVEREEDAVGHGARIGRDDDDSHWTDANGGTVMKPPK
jgi:hypothetical protein